MGPSPSIRSFGSVLNRFSNGFPSKHSISIVALHSSVWSSKNISSSSSYSPASWVQSFETHSVESVRKIWTSSPLCMGRRSCKIAGRKGAQDAKKAKLYSKVGKEVVSAIKKGGSNPVSNLALAAVLQKVKDLDIPKEIIDRNIKRAAEKGQEAYIEKIYEVYGFGGAGIIVEVSTDKINRSIAAIRGVLKDCGGKMADSGSIMFKFRRARVVNVKVTDADKDQLLTIALDAGADDVIEPPVYEDDTEEDLADRYYKIVSSTENYPEILAKLREEGITFEPDNGSEFLPENQIEVDDEALELNKELMSRLLDLDDVDAVYTDQK